MLVNVIQAAFAAPDFPGDETKTRAAVVLNFLVNASLLISLLMLLGTYFLFTAKTINALMILLGFGVILAAKQLIRRGHVGAANLLFIGLGWVLATVSLYLGNGTSGTTLGLYVALTVMAALTLNIRWALAIGGVNSAVLLVFAWLETSGYPFPHVFPELPFVRWLDFTVFTVFTIVPVYLVRRGLSAALHDAEQENDLRRQAEQQTRTGEEYFRALIENARDVIVAIDAEGRLSVRAGTTEMALGYSREELRGKLAFDFIHPDDQYLLRDLLGDQTAEGQLVANMQMRVKTGGGDWRVFEVDGKKLFDHPVVKGCVINARDITERQALEGQLRQAQKMDAFGQLAGGIAHDFNNLLVPIVGYTDLTLRTLPKDEVAYSHLQIVKRAAQQASALIGQILAFSRKQLLQVSVQDLNQLVAEFEKLVLRLIGEDVHLEHLFDVDVLKVKIDKNQIEQVLLNLAVNARDAMPDGGHLTIRTSRVSVDKAGLAGLLGTINVGDYAELSVTDTGQGIEKPTLQQIFEPFFTTKSPGKGTGLGLATVLGIVEQHGGNILVESEVGRGACFKILLPLTDAELEPELVNDALLAPVGGTENILVVDDDELVCRLVVDTLAAQGYQVTTCSGSAEALNAATDTKARFDLILLDVIMPEMNGPELYRQIKSAHPGIAVLYMSGNSDNMLGERGVLDEGVALLKKPFGPDQILYAVRDALPRSTQQST